MRIFRWISKSWLQRILETIWPSSKSKLTNNWPCCCCVQSSPDPDCLVAVPPQQLPPCFCLEISACQQNIHNWHPMKREGAAKEWVGSLSPFLTYKRKKYIQTHGNYFLLVSLEIFICDHKHTTFILNCCLHNWGWENKQKNSKEKHKNKLISLPS